MPSRQYYSARKGRTRDALLDLDLLRRLFVAVYKTFASKHYLDEAFGTHCTDAGYTPGTAGEDIEMFVFRRLRKQQMYPISAEEYVEDDIFDWVELLYDLVSKPQDGYYHSWNDCGWHYASYDKEAGRQEFREEINEVLADYGDGYELSPNGEVRQLPGAGLDKLVGASLPPTIKPTDHERVLAAIDLFRKRSATSHDRRNAVRMLADVLEPLRAQLSQVITAKDEGDLFHIANAFGIRHNRDDQKTQYDPVWLSSMFYHYLATIHVVTRRLGNLKQKP
jgi:hypothetical protein